MTRERSSAAWMVVLAVVGLGAVGCVGAGGGASGMDGGSGTGGFTGGTGGFMPDGGRCFECFPGCFDCFNTGCFECSGGAGGDGDAGVTQQVPWVPPFQRTGENGGWRSTGDDTLCVGGGPLDGFSLWSDERGVYAMADGNLDARVIVGTKSAGSAKAGSGGAQDKIVLPPGAAPPFMDAGFAGAGGFGGNAGIGGTGGTAGGGGGGTCLEGFEQCQGRVIYFNDGVSGWKVEHRTEAAAFGGARLSGLPLSELAVHSRFPDAAGCSLALINSGAERCDQSGSGIEAFFGVDPQLAFATIGTNLLVYDGAVWNVHPTPLPFAATAMWADATSVVIVGDLGRISRLRDGVWTNSNRTIESLTAVWAGADDELWVGTAGGEILHRDREGTWQTTLSLRGVTCIDRDPIRGIWGSGDTVYFHTDRALARWDGSALRELGNWTCALPDPNFGFNPRAIRNIWGNGPDELFVAMTDGSRFFSRFFDECGDGFVLYFDGTEFHRL